MCKREIYKEVESRTSLPIQASATLVYGFLNPFWFACPLNDSGPS